MISRFFLALCGYQARDGGGVAPSGQGRATRDLPGIDAAASAPVASPDLYDHLPAFLRLLGES